METTYKQNEMNVYRIAVQLEQLIKKEQSLSVADWMQRITDIEQQLQMRKFRLAVVGEFNRGKSSFINVLLGKKILPEDVLATTATINRVTYGETPKAYLIRKNGNGRSEEIPVEELAAYVTKLTESSAKAAAEIQEAVVEYPTMFCYNDVDLIDTPGMNDMDDMNAVTVNQLDDIDLAVVTINAQYPYSETENKVVVKLLESKKICQIIFVITHFDVLREREKSKITNYLYSRIKTRVLEELNQSYKPEDSIFHKYHRIFDNLRLYGVSSVDAMDALESNDMELYEKSGYLQLNKELPEVILSSKSVNMIDNMVTLLEGMIAEYKEELGENPKEQTSWTEVGRYLEKLFSSVIAQMQKTAKQEFELKEQNSIMEAQKQNTTKRLLKSLGSIEVLNFAEVQKAIIPTLRQEFMEISSIYESRRVNSRKIVYGQKWDTLLESFIEKMDAKFQEYPRLSSLVEEETKQLKQLLKELLEEKKQSLDVEPSPEKAQETAFYWLDSFIRTACETEYGHSVLPGFRKIVSDSIEDCEKRLEENLNNEFFDDIEKAGRFFKSYMKVFYDTAMELEKGAGQELKIEQLSELERECALLHEKIRA